MKRLDITLDFESPSQIENQTTSSFDWADLYQPTTDISFGGQVYIIPQDSDCDIMPAHYNDELPYGELMKAVILCNKYTLNGVEYRFNKLVGIEAYCVDDGGCNNYHVAPRFRDKEPAVIPPVMVHEFADKYKNAS